MQLLGRIMEGGVLEAFLDRGARFAPVLRDIPLIVVTNDMLGLLGARQYALKLLDENITEVRSSPDCCAWPLAMFVHPHAGCCRIVA
jgi:Glucokinase